MKAHLKLFGVLCAAALLALGGKPPVADAAMRGEIETVRLLLRQGADVNAPQGDGMTALHWAAELGHVEMTEILLQAGADVRAVTRLGNYTALHLASRAGQAGTVEALLKGGSDPNVATSTGGATALHFAAGSGSVGMIEALLDAGADVNVRESVVGQTPLIFAASYDRLNAVKVLLERGADVGIQTAMEDPARKSATSRAAQQTRNEVLESIRPEAEARVVGYTPQEIQQAVLAGRRAEPAEEEEAEEEEEEDPDAIRYGRVGDYGGLTALLHATREGHRDVAIALLDAGADIEQAGTAENVSPLLMAIVNGHFDLAMLLLERGANPHFRSNSGNNTLYAVLDAQWAGKSTARPRQRSYEQQETTYLELMQTLLDAGVDPNLRMTTAPPYEPRANSSISVSGATPFFRATYATDVAAMRLLLSYGADHTLTTTNSGRSRRSFRGRGGRGRGGRGGSGNETRADPSGLPPVPEGGPGVHHVQAAAGVGYGQGFAAHSHRHVPDGWMPTMRYLVDELGHDVNTRDSNGYSALHHAASRGDHEMIFFLMERGADPTVVSRRGQTVADMANGPSQRLQIFPETIELMMKMGSKLTPKRR